MTETVARLHPIPAEDAPGPRDFALARAIKKHSPESTSAWVRAIGPALGPAAYAMEALAELAASP
jgi:hypothetical protein